jgi:hypothetical protein
VTTTTVLLQFVPAEHSSFPRVSQFSCINIFFLWWTRRRSKCRRRNLARYQNKGQRNEDVSMLILIVFFFLINIHGSYRFARSRGNRLIARSGQAMTRTSPK